MIWLFIYAASGTCMAILLRHSIEISISVVIPDASDQEASWCVMLFSALVAIVWPYFFLSIALRIFK